MASRSRAVICLLRNNLRYHDNEVFQWAHRNSDFVVPIYCFDPRHYKGTWHFSFPKTGPHKLKFLLESIADLRDVLKQKGSGLIIRQGKPEAIIPELIKSLQSEVEVTGLVYENEATKEELDVEEALRVLCSVPIKTFWASSLYHKDDIPFKASQVPNVYSDFRKQVENRSQVRPLVQMPDKLKPLPPGVEEGELPTYPSFGIGDPVSDDRTAFPFSGGETTGLGRLDFYLWGSDKVATYKETRNGLIGEDYSTKFSPWLAHGCISPRQIYWEVKRYEKERTSNQSTYWVIFELLWRDYFKFVALKFGDKLFYRSGVRGLDIPWKKDMHLFEAWKTGKTGVPFVDANMREMAATGFMSNRGRQNVASFLVKDLGLDWLLGAEWFEHLLTDHDVCSNYGNWQYSAGVGNDPRQDRKFNMVKQGLDYDAEINCCWLLQEESLAHFKSRKALAVPTFRGDYIRRWVPELQGIKGGNVHVPWTLSPNVLARADVKLGETYPQPIVIAPEWSRHVKKPGSASRGGGRGGGARGGGPSAKQRGIDFYFKGGKTF